MSYCYQQMDFDDFAKAYGSALTDVELFELSLPWLAATRDYMLPKGAQVIVHCLFKANQTEQVAAELLVAWPLVHQKNLVRSLTSFYSAVSEPFILQSIDAEALSALFGYIGQKHRWHQMQLGPFEQQGLAAQIFNNAIAGLGINRVFNQTDNFYQKALTNFADYYQQLPSQLKNTVKRRSNKLVKQHSYQIEIVTDVEQFALAFTAYKTIYQQSWKGEEYSFAFIEQVCRQALAQDQLRLGLLKLDGEPAAAQIWFVQAGQCDKTAAIFKLAYAAKFAEFSVGSILSMALSEYVIDKDKVTSIEFGMGSEAYKQDWLSNKRQRISYQIFNKGTLYGNFLGLGKIILPKIKQYLGSSR